MKITTNAPSVDRELTVTFDLGSSLDEAVKLFGKEIVFSHFQDNAVIALQGFVRSRLARTDDKYLSDAAIKAAVKNSFKLGGRTIDPSKRIERVSKDFAKLDDKTRAKLFRDWQREQQGQKAKLVKTPKPAATTEVTATETPTETEPTTV
jgi:hypothetical protein